MPMSGKITPFSHLDTALLETHRMFPNSLCVYPFSVRAARISSPVAFLSIKATSCLVLLSAYRKKE